MNTFVRNCLISGTAAGLLSLIASAWCSRREHGEGSEHLPMHAVSHIAWDDSPRSHTGCKPHNAVVGTALHQGASVFWAGFFELLFGRRAERSTPAALVGGATIATMAYVTDYHSSPIASSRVLKRISRTGRSLSCMRRSRWVLRRGRG